MLASRTADIARADPAVPVLRRGQANRVPGDGELPVRCWARSRPRRPGRQSRPWLPGWQSPDSSPSVARGPFLTTANDSQAGSHTQRLPGTCSAFVSRVPGRAPPSSPPFTQAEPCKLRAWHPRRPWPALTPPLALAPDRRWRSHRFARRGGNGGRWSGGTAPRWPGLAAHLTVWWSADLLRRRG